MTGAARGPERRGAAARLMDTARRVQAPAGWLTSAAGACLLLGIVAGVLGVLFLPRAAWGALLANTLFWAGLAQGGVVLAAVFHLTGARWGRVVERIAAAMGAFLPFSFLLLLLLWFGRGYVFPWLAGPDRHPWIEAPWLFLWDGLALAGATALSLTFLYHTSHPDGDRRPQVLRPLAVAVVVGYFLACALLAVDLGMSPLRRFHSTIFPVIFLTGSFYSAVAATAAITAVWRRRSGLQQIIDPAHLLDLGNLVWGFAMFQAYTWGAQYLIVWMANLPAEVGHHLQRWEAWPWDALTWADIACALVVPGLVLASRRWKQNALVLLVVGSVAAFGVLLQRLLDILPFVGVSGGTGAALVVAGVSIGFLGAAALPYLWLMRRVPLFPAEDPLFVEELLLRDVRV